MPTIKDTNQFEIKIGQTFLECRKLVNNPVVPSLENHLKKRS